MSRTCGCVTWPRVYLRLALIGWLSRSCMTRLWWAARGSVSPPPRTRSDHAPRVIILGRVVAADGPGTATSAGPPENALGATGQRSGELRYPQVREGEFELGDLDDLCAKLLGHRSAELRH